MTLTSMHIIMLQRQRLRRTIGIVILLLTSVLIRTRGENALAPNHWTARGLSQQLVTKWRNAFREKSILMCWSTGHTGTLSLTDAFGSLNSSYSVNELYPLGNAHSLPIQKRYYHSENATLLWQHMDNEFLPFLYQYSLDKTYIFIFGHNSIFGLLPAMMQLFSSVKIVRLHRDPCQVISSFLGNPPICPEYQKDERGFCVQFCPGDLPTRWHSEKLREVWHRGPAYRKQLLSRVWWYIDEVELQWQQLLLDFPDMQYIEVYWDDGPSLQRTVGRIAEFAGVNVPQELENLNHHSAGFPEGNDNLSTRNATAVQELREQYMRVMSTTSISSEFKSVALASCNASLYMAPPSVEENQEKTSESPKEESTSKNSSTNDESNDFSSYKRSGPSRVNSDFHRQQVVISTMALVLVVALILRRRFQFATRTQSL